MQPAVFFPRKYQAVAGTPENLIAGDHRVKGAARTLVTVPNLSAHAGGGVGHADRPRSERFTSRSRTARAEDARPADERDSAAVRAPGRIAVEVCAWVGILQRLVHHAVNSDKGVFGAIADEGESTAIGR